MKGFRELVVVFKRNLKRGDGAGVLYDLSEHPMGNLVKVLVGNGEKKRVLPRMCRSSSSL